MKRYRVRGKRWLASILAVLMITSGMLSVPIGSYAAESDAENLAVSEEETLESAESEEVVSDTEITPVPDQSTAPTQEEDEEVTTSITPEDESSDPTEEPTEEPTGEPEETPLASPNMSPSVSPVPSIEPLVREDELPYKGDVYEQPEGDCSLFISQFSVESFNMEWNADTVLRILSEREKEDTRYTYISLQGTNADWTENIPADVWNQMVGLMKEPTDGFSYSICVSREGKSDELDVQCSIYAPVTTKEAVDTTITYELTDFGMRYRGNRRTVPSQYGSITVNLSASNSKSIYQKLTSVFNENTTYFIADINGKKISDGVDVSEYTGDGYANMYISIYDCGTLLSGEQYQVTEYLGSVTEYQGNKFLSLVSSGNAFTEKQIIRIMESKKDLGPFKGISIYQDGTDNNIIWKSVTNMAKDLLTEDGSVYWEFTENDTGYSPEWTLYGLKEQDEDIEVEISLNNTGGIPKFSVNRTQFPAERVAVGVQGYSWKGAGRGLTLIKAMMGEESKLIMAKNEEKAAGGFYRIEDDHNFALFYFEDITEFEPNTQYILGERPSYCGTVNESDGWKELVIDNSSGEYSNEQLADMIYMNQKDSFNHIQICFDAAKDAGIPRVVHNAAVKRLVKGSGEYGDIEYRYVDSDGLTSLLLSSSTDIEQDIADESLPQFYTKGSEAYFKCGSQYPVQMNASVAFLINKNSADFSVLKNLFGTAERLSFTLSHGEDKLEGLYQYRPSAISVSFMNIQNSRMGVEYTVDRYRGEIDGNNLYLQAVNMGSSKFSVSDIQDITEYYEQKEVKFSRITIDQDYSSSKASAYTIPKDMINAVRQILTEDGELVFCFSRGTATGDGYLPNDLRLNLYRPGEATKDVVINVSTTLTPNQGVTLKLNKNKIEANAEQIGLQILASSQSEFGKQLSDALGDPADGDRYQTVVLKNNLVDNTVYYDYWKENGNYILNLGAADAIEKDVPYRLFVWKEPKDSEGNAIVFERGKNVVLQTTYPVDSGKKVTWKSYGSGVVSDITENGEMTILGVSGEIFYYSATYVSNKTTYMEVWRGTIKEAKIESIRFDRDKIVMVLPDETDQSISQEEKENQRIGYLNVKFTPSNAPFDSEELIWEVKEGDAVELVGDITNKKYTGKFRICKAGTAVITATYPDTNVSAACTIVVQDPLTDEEIGVKDLDKLYAVLNFDQTLKDVPLANNWKWKEPDTKLVAYGEAEGYNFPAVYTADDGRTTSRMLYVRFAKIDSICITGLDLDGEEGNPECLPYDLPKEIVKGDQIVLGIRYNINNGDVTDLAKYRERLDVKWECKNKETVLSEEQLDSYWENSIRFSVTENSKKEKKTINLSLVDKNSGKVLMKANSQISVLNGNLINWDKLETNAYDNTVDSELYFKLPKDGAYKLTVKSSDTGVLKIGKVTTKEVSEENVTYVVTTVTYKVLKPGISYLVITAADEAKSSISIRKEWRDVEPKLENDKIMINKALKDDSAEIVLYADSQAPAVADEIALVEKNNSFIITDRKEVVDGNVQKISIIIKPVNNKIKNAKYKLDVLIPVKNGENTENYIVKAEVTVKETSPAVTFKQTKKVNLFYTDAEGNGLLALTAADQIEDLQLINCDYELVPTDSDTEYQIQRKAGVNGNKTNGKGVLEYRIAGYQKTYTVKFNVAVENKAPAIALSAAQDTLYPNNGEDFSELILTDKATGERLQLTEAVLALKKENIALSDEAKYIDIGKHQYMVSIAATSQKGQSIYIILVTKEKETKATDTFTLNVREKNWSKALKVTYKINVEIKNPTAVLGNKKLTLNKNEELFLGESAETTIRWKGSNAAVPSHSSIRFEGVNKTSREVLNKDLILDYLEEEGVIIASLNDNKLSIGSYKYKVWINNVSIPLEINVVDKEAVKCAGLSKAGGGIDVLQRENTALLYKIKLTNLTGTVKDVYLQGTDGALFEGKINDKGQLQISASDWASLSTKASYKVQPILIVETRNGGDREIAAPVQTIKVKQGNPKVSIASSGNVFYRQRNNEVVVGLNSVLNGQKVTIEDVYLGNYSDQFELLTDEEGLAFDHNTGCVTIRIRKDSDRVYQKSGAKYNLNLMIRYRDKAGNEKDQKISYSITIK